MREGLIPRSIGLPIVIVLLAFACALYILAVIDMRQYLSGKENTVLDRLGRIFFKTKK
jgi:hypothetical protein